MDGHARALLPEVGWRDGGRRSTDALSVRPQQRGFVPHAAARASVERFGGLRARGDRGDRGDTTRPRDTVTRFLADPDDVATDPSWIPGREPACGTRVVPIGATPFRPVRPHDRRPMETGR